MKHTLEHPQILFFVNVFNTKLPKQLCQHSYSKLTCFWEDATAHASSWKGARSEKNAVRQMNHYGVPPAWCYWVLACLGIALWASLVLRIPCFIIWQAGAGCVTWWLLWDEQWNNKLSQCLVAHKATIDFEVHECCACLVFWFP